MRAEFVDETQTVTSELGSITAHSNGAQLTSWNSVEAGEMLFVSSNTKEGFGVPIRGGVPICFPWFGAVREWDDRVALLGGGLASGSHGFARKVLWRQAGVRFDDHGTRTLAYELTEEDLEEQGYEDVQPFYAVMRVGFEGVVLALDLAVANTGNQVFRFESALHTYFRVGDVEKVLVDGLEGTEYFDKTAGTVRVQEGPISFDGEVDRVYQSQASVVIADPSTDRRIRVSKKGSGTTVVWNPGREAARNMPDLGEGQWREFVCVETANAAESAVVLEPGQSHKMSVRYEVETLGL